jgi:5-methylcytosine-specific restriction endonuclease McrA
MKANKRLPWRCKNQKQAKDKAIIYNSKEWQQLRIEKLRANPLCEVCQAQGFVKSAHCVHHKHPIEDSHSMQEMKHWAFMWENLQSLCDSCHAAIHKQQGKGTKALAIERAQQRHDRWADGLMQRFTTTNPDEEPTTQTPGGSF